jgi:hypothetical protein
MRLRIGSVFVRSSSRTFSSITSSRYRERRLSDLRAANAAAALLEAVAVGDLTPAEARELGKLIEAYIKALEATDFVERLTKLERMTNR